ncbi:hypothetical protein [Bradyrhizobium sp.]|uniref:hypothetical protein n=1 Tax=Bradyrhizobium sp. TaxID=376 RepID=UPI0023855F51|nr:hypothetical protein [Bradyrhizobium sp.]MDE2378716.1 hypothetical protein [Bradyrhizobium sp.]
MKRLILTSSSGADLAKSKLAEIVVFFFFRFVWGPLPSPDYLAAYFGARSGMLRPGDHWSDWGIIWPRAFKDRRNRPLAEFCERYDEIELWFDPSPQDQLQLIWLLDHFGSHPELAPKLKLRLVDFDLSTQERQALANSRETVRMVDITSRELETGSMAWQAYRALTPEPSVDLLRKNLSALPLLGPAWRDLLNELPSATTGLGGTEMRLLELIATGRFRTNGLFYLRGFRQLAVFNDVEIGSLLEGLAHGPRPAISGMDDELRTLPPDNLRARVEAYRRSQPALTDFGRAILAHEADFSHHNPIDRWWGGTRLTSDRLWRFGSALTSP